MSDYTTYTICYESVSTMDADALRSRAIAPAVAAARGIRTITKEEAAAYGFKGVNARSGTLIPSWSTQDEISGYQLRPHDPPTDDKGKIKKYLWPTGTQLHLDVPRASLPVIRDVNIPIIITESSLKADAVQSAIAPTAYGVLAISGVYGWRSQDAPLSDFGDIPWKTKAHNKVTFRRTIYILFDSDTRTNPGVSRTRYELSEFLRRKKALVYWIEVPTTPDGGKQGIDDALAAGHKLDDLIATATPAPNVMPIIDAPLNDSSEPLSEIDQLLAENEQLRRDKTRLLRDNATLILLFRNQHVPAKTKQIAVSIATEAMSKASRGDLTPNGKVRLESREIANDHRPVPKPGKSRAELNRDGSKPIVSRASAISLVKQAKEQGIFRVDLMLVNKQIGDARPYRDTEIEVMPPTSLADFLSSVATYAPAEHQPRKAYTRQAPCEHCGEVHSRTQMTVCDGCGVIVDVKMLKIPTAPDDELDDQIAATEATSTKNVEVRIAPSLPALAPRNYLSIKNVEVGESPLDSPPDLASTKNVMPPPTSGYLPGMGEVAGHDRWTT